MALMLVIQVAGQVHWALQALVEAVVVESQQGLYLLQVVQVEEVVEQIQVFLRIKQEQQEIHLLLVLVKVVQAETAVLLKVTDMEQLVGAEEQAQMAQMLLEILEEMVVLVYKIAFQELQHIIVGAVVVAVG
jgi:hypothetical protein